MLDLFTYAQRGLTGIITDTGGQPIDARVSIEPAVKRAYNDPVTYIPFTLTDPDVGDYHLPIQPGTYDLKIEADGYITKYIPGVIVPDEDPWYVVVNEQLDPGMSTRLQPYRPPDYSPDSVPPDLREE